MNKSLLAAFTIAAIVAGSPVGTQQARAGTAIQRCQQPGGVSVYTDKPCAALGAKAVPISGELLTRIAREESIAAAATGVEVGFAPTDASMAVAPATGRRAVAGGCARTPTQLAMDLRGAFALGDVNRIAESYHWTGTSSASAVRIMERLESLARNPLADTHYYDAQIFSGDATLASSGADATGGSGGSGGIMQLTFGGDGKAISVTDLDVERYAGCYFVRF